MTTKLVVHAALETLTLHDTQNAELLKFNYIAELTTDEAAGVLGLSGPTTNVVGLTPAPGFTGKVSVR